MALHTSLPIYKVAYDLLFVAVDYVASMPRAYKPAFGRSLSDLGIAVIQQIRHANRSREKAPHLETLLERLAEFEVLLRLYVDKKWISRKQYATAVELATSVGKQATAWSGKPHAASPAI